MIVKPGVGVEHVVAIELVGIAMERVRSRLGYDVDNVAGAPAILSGEGIVLHLEFLDSIDGRHIVYCAPLRIRIPDAIEQIS